MQSRIQRFATILWKLTPNAHASSPENRLSACIRRALDENVVVAAHIFSKNHIEALVEELKRIESENETIV